MNLLVVLSRNPTPLRIGSGILAYNCMKLLSANHDISLLCLQSEGDVGAAPDFVKSAAFVSHRPPSRFVTLWRRRCGKLRGIPSSVIDVKSKSMNERVRRLLLHRKFDAIVLFEMEAIQYCPTAWHHNIVVNIEDPPSLKLMRLRELPIWSNWQKHALRFSGHIIENYEKQIVPKLGKVLLLSQGDVKDMQEQGDYKNLAFMPYGIDIKPSTGTPGYEERSEGMIVYSGNMFHPPNVDGALNFLQKIFPLVLRQYSTAVLWIVGTDPDRRIREQATRFGEHVIITGRVQDVADYLCRARVSVCPVRLKIGCQTKILEALSCGTPVVTTSAGNSGIEGCTGEDLWVEDKSIEFARRIVTLLRGDDWDRLSENGKKLVAEKFSWERSAATLEEHIKGIASHVKATNQNQFR